MTARDRLVDLACRLQEVTKSPNSAPTETRCADRPTRSAAEPKDKEGR